MLERMDMLGIPCQFYFNQHPTYSTKFGGAVGILMGIVMAVLFVLFGSEFYYRTNPSVTTEIGTFEQYPNFTLSSTNFTLIFALEDESGNAYNDDSEIFIEMKQIVYSSNPYVKRPFSISKCKDLNYSSTLIQSTKRFENHYCLNLNDTIVGGFWDSDFVSYFSLNAKQCVKGQKAPSGINCTGVKSSLLSENMLYLSMYMQKYYYNPSDYDVPLKFNIQNDYIMLDPNIKKVKRYFFALTTSDSNYGWLLDSSIKESVLNVDRIEDDINLKREDDSSYGNILFYFDKKYILYTRNYQKLQTLAANVGGVMKFFVVIGAFIVKKYSLFYLLDDLSLALTKNNEEDSGQVLTTQNIQLNNFVAKLEREKKQPSSKPPEYLNTTIKLPQLTEDNKNSSFIEYQFRYLLNCFKRDEKLAEQKKISKSIFSKLDVKGHILRQILYDECFKGLLGDQMYSSLESKYFTNSIRQ